MSYLARSGFSQNLNKRVLTVAYFYRFERASRAEVVLALHHIEEDGDGGFSQFRLGDQRDLQNGPDHGGDELHFVLA